MKDPLETLPPELQAHVERARRGLTNGASGPQRVAGRESLDAILKALVGARGRADALWNALQSERERL